MDKPDHYRQEPMAIVGLGCRLPGGNSSLPKLWDFLERGDVAPTNVPGTRFNLDGHYDGSLKPRTMRQPGGMFLNDIDLADFDAGFFEVGRDEAISMDPNQRQLLEVVFEALQSAGITLEDVDGQSVGCFVGSYACDYADMHNRDPEDRPGNNAVGVARALLANRLSHFLNLKGPSVTIDTACSGSLQGLDVACRYLQTKEIDTAVIAASNLYMSPEHLIDTGSFGTAHSPTALCHTFDVAADGYVKAEAVSSIIVKRLDDAIKHRDPIRAIILGTASTSNGRTPGIASPSAASQALAIRAAYSNAGIVDLNQTTYLECHGTGTQAGDPTEVEAIGSVFAATRSVEQPLLIGSIKSNIGHSEPAAGISGTLKAILAMENGFIPGTPTFINPNPKIDFLNNKVRAFRTGMAWPEHSPRRASINSFGVGGSNAHVIIEHPDESARANHVSSYISADDGFGLNDIDVERPYIIALSANDSSSLHEGIRSLSSHLINPRVDVNVSDLAYTLSERRTKSWHRAFSIAHNAELSDRPERWVITKKSSQPINLGFVFTGQGSQWPQMGKDLRLFQSSQRVLQELDRVLQGLSHPPSWSVVSELTQPRSSDHFRQPELSQTLTTALQLCLVDVLEAWGIRPQSVIGHSSGEIAAAYTAGLLDRASAITAAYYRGKAASMSHSRTKVDMGMLAVGLGADEASNFLQPFIGKVWIACFNSPTSITVSGENGSLETLRESIVATGHFARLLQVDLAYHSELIGGIADEYERLLGTDATFKSDNHEMHGRPIMFSSVTASRQVTCTSVSYWKQNMTSPVRFQQALGEMLSDNDTAPNFLIEIGPSGTLAGPISQIIQSEAGRLISDVAYCSAWSRGTGAGRSLFDVAGRLWGIGYPLSLAVVNEYNDTERTIIDLPGYNWNHSVKYWHESSASKDWRFRKFIVHDLLGSKVLGTPWQSPTWRSRLNVTNLPYLLEHRIGGNAIMPGAGFITMAMEAMYQKHCVSLEQEGKSFAFARGDLAYQFRDIRFNRALVLEEGKDIRTLFTLTAVSGSKSWHSFRISTSEGEVVQEHCSGSVRVQDPSDEVAQGNDALPLRFPQPASLWYKWLRNSGTDFGPNFQKFIEIEAITGLRESSAFISLESTERGHSSQSVHPIDPASLDGCIQTPFPAIACGDRASAPSPVIPRLIDDLFINRVSSSLSMGRSRATSSYSGRGRLDQPQSWMANTSVYDTENDQLVVRITGLHYAKLDVVPKPDPHTFHSLVWKPDISLLTQDQLHGLTPSGNLSRLDVVIDLVAYRKPSLRVLEINLDEADASSIWFENGDVVCRSAYSHYTFGSSNAHSLVQAQTLYSEQANSSFHLISAVSPKLDLPEEGSFDLIILKDPRVRTDTSKQNTITELRSLLSKEGYLLTVNIVDSHSDNGANTMRRTMEKPERESTCITFSMAASSDGAESFRSTLTNEFTSTITVADVCNDQPLADLIRQGAGILEDQPSDSSSHLIVASLSASLPSPLPTALQSMLEVLGWNITHMQYPFSKVEDGSVIIVLDELRSPLMSQVSEDQWIAFKALINLGIPLLWVTVGAQDTATNPENGMINGIFRVARQEEPRLRLHTLDVTSATGPATEYAIANVLELLRRDNTMETEYMERDGMLHIQRIIPDDVMNDFRRAEDEGLAPVIMDLHGNEAQVQLRAERLGTLEGLMWCESETNEVEDLGAGNIEVEVMATGVNFKDVAIVMGIISDDEYKLGVECSGIVRRLGAKVDKFKAGDRVCMLAFGTYANRVRVSADRCHIIPAAMSFEEAAVIPSVYLCSLYAMYHLGGLKEGQSVLIHSAAGGVGIACIELALHKKAEIFATVGTDEKRQFLETKYGIPSNHIFSSRDAKFSTEILKATKGCGVNVVINSLVGELLDASWRIVADGGNMIEIGKRDILDRNTLSMEPFGRNCSFRALDMSYSKHVNDKLVASLFVELFDLINAGCIKVSHPIATFRPDDVAGALTLIRGARHIGKIVVSYDTGKDIQIPIRPAIRVLRLDPAVSYLIVGGLRGACGTLAVHLAQHGARHIVVNSRSGLRDKHSGAIVASCKAYQCDITEACGDVGDIDFVRRMFKSANPRIAGVIQGAMLLRDKPFETMTHEDFQTAIYAKVKGTKNLHQAAGETQAQRLDFFTMLSSISGIVGNKGQANYAAANTFLDAFASYRRSLGLRANTVDIGVIEDVGYIAEKGSAIKARFDTRLWTPINEHMLRRILTYSILQQSDSTPISANSRDGIITGISYPLPSEATELASDPRFSYLFNSRVEDSGKAGGLNNGDDGDLDQQCLGRFRLLQASGDHGPNLKMACLELISNQCVKTLRLQEEPEAGRPLMAYGLDSLSAVEVRNWIRAKLGVELTTLDINTSSLLTLCEKVIANLPCPQANGQITALGGHPAS